MRIRHSTGVLACVAAAALAGCRTACLPRSSVTALAQDREDTDSPRQEPLRRVHLVAVGDVMLDRGVGAAIRKRGPQSIFECVRDQLRAGDITFANLESPLSARGPHAPKDCVFRADPATAAVLIDGAIDIVSVANNHTLNSGRRTLMDTLDVLDRNGILYCGARRQSDTSWWPVYVNVNGLRLAFMAYTDLSFTHGAYNKVDADMSNLVEHIGETDAKCDLLIVSFHWGEEYQRDPSRRQRDVARAAIEAGADLILGHHPHVLQGMAAYRGAPILYSMGNFVFDQRTGEKMESAIFDIEYVDLWGWDVKATPVIIPHSRFGPEYPPRERAKKIAKRLCEISARLGSYPRVESDNSIVLHVSGQHRWQTASVQPRRAAEER
jgi:poly-gamma-glutamate capsule biosynthesis protein CapA/YwtB (metallophosphatase superfamily)